MTYAGTLRKATLCTAPARQRTRAPTRPDGTSIVTSTSPSAGAGTRPDSTAHAPSAIVPCPHAVDVVGARRVLAAVAHGRAGYVEHAFADDPERLAGRVVVGRRDLHGAKFAYGRSRWETRGHGDAGGRGTRDRSAGDRHADRARGAGGDPVRDRGRARRAPPRRRRRERAAVRRRRARRDRGRLARRRW